MKHVPEWFPGGGFKKFARLAKETIDKSIDLPLQHVKESFQVREPHLSRGLFVETSARRIRLPFLRSWRRVLRNCQSSVKTGSMKRRSGVWAGQYISVSVYYQSQRWKLALKKLAMHQGGEETVGRTEFILGSPLTVPLRRRRQPSSRSSWRRPYIPRRFVWLKKSWMMSSVGTVCQSFPISLSCHTLLPL